MLAVATDFHAPRATPEMRTHVDIILSVCLAKVCATTYCGMLLSNIYDHNNHSLAVCGLCVSSALSFPMRYETSSGRSEIADEQKCVCVETRMRRQCCRNQSMEIRAKMHSADIDNIENVMHFSCNRWLARQHEIITKNTNFNHEIIKLYT